MEDVPEDVGVDARIIVEHLRSAIANLPPAYPRTWLPQATVDELFERADREPIHFHQSLHHLHHRWDMDHARARERRGWTPKALGQRIVGRIVNSALDRYFTEEQEYRAALAQSIDAIAYRVDEIASADERNLVEIIRRDLLDLARYVDERIDTRLTDR